MKKTIMGIDQSTNSTGICINKGDENIYYLITSHATKKMKCIEVPFFKIIEYAKGSQTGLNTWQKEFVKGHNVWEISKIIGSILDENKPDVVVTEAIAFQASGTIDQLAGLSYAIRMECYKRNIPCFVLPPTSIKLRSVGSGTATKELMIETWEMLDDRFKNLPIKKDDLADAYHMAHFPLEVFED
jgi:hypothetical protein